MDQKLNELMERYPALADVKQDIKRASELIIGTYQKSGKILVCGNGGSCADSDHIVGELMKGFLKKRPVGAEFQQKLSDAGFADAKELCQHLQGSLPAISLPSQSAILSAFANDVSPEMVYAQMVYGYAEPGDLLICLSTSGNSANVVCAAKVAKAKGAATLALTGKQESRLSELCDVTVRVNAQETYQVQELHLPVYHYLCAAAEEAFFEE